MVSLNKVQLIGRLGETPKISSMQNGTKIANFNVATTDSWKDKATGERKDRTEWNRVVVFNPQLVDIAEKYLQKGSSVYIEGSLQTRKYEDAKGVEKFVTEVVLQNYSGNIIMLDSKKSDGTSDEKYDQAWEEAGKKAREKAEAQSDDVPSADLDDDIPFN